MLSNAKNHYLVNDVPPGYREYSGKDIHYIEDIDPKFHQGNYFTCAWSASSILIDLI